MPFWMTNPKHGVMPVYSFGEVDQAKVHGWELLNEGDAPARPAPAAKAVQVDTPARKKPGPKPKAK
jgi:hypothetical protein